MSQPLSPKGRPEGRSARSVPSPAVSRRELLRIFSGVAGVAATRLDVKAALPARAAAGAATTGSPYAPRFFSVQEMRSLAALAETIIPTDDHSPGAETAGAHEFMDDMVADSDSKTHAFWREGIEAVEKDSLAQFGKGFAALTDGQRTALLEKVATNESHPQTIEERFFVALKKMTIEGYYTSAVGIHQDLNYQGNTAMADFEGCKHPDHK